MLMRIRRWWWQLLALLFRPRLLDPYTDAMRVVHGMRAAAKRAADSLTIRCVEPGCREPARFRGVDAESIWCVGHAREAQILGGARLRHFAQPEAVYKLHEACSFKTARERRELRANALSRRANLLTMEQVEHRLGMDLQVEEDT